MLRAWALTVDPDAALRETVCSVGASLFQCGYVHAAAGNISGRLPEGRAWLITPTDACMGRLAQMDAQGRQAAPLSPAAIAQLRCESGALW